MRRGLAQESNVIELRLELTQNVDASYVPLRDDHAMGLGTHRSCASAQTTGKAAHTVIVCRRGVGVQHRVYSETVRARAY
eukprot:3138437-Prymnesium_polylepis.1